MGNKCTCCKPPSTPQQLAAVGPTRKVFVGPELNHHRYPTNRIHTTKYTPLNFIPKALLLQFIKPANTIFLMTAILQCITVISALSPFTAIAPFVVVLGISLVREAYEDYVTISETQKRRRNDHQTNNTPTEVLRGGQFVPCKWKDLHAGDIVRVKSGQQIPADLVLLATSQENGICYVETSNLDGQRNLKPKMLAQEIRMRPEQLEALRGGYYQVDEPNLNLHDFAGSSHLPGLPVKALSQQNLLLRATKLQNTDWAVGCAVYTGKQTKIMLNLNRVRHKVSRIERKVNILQICLFCVLFFLCLTSSLMYFRVWHQYNARDNIFYLRTKYHWSISKDAAVLSLTSFLLLNFLIPISMNISMEIMRTFQGDLLEYDIEMSIVRDNKRERCHVLNCTIIEELGNVEYLLTDKTGTLTSNEMIFQYVWINGQEHTAKAMLQSKQQLQQNREFVEFWTYVTLSHDVIVNKKTQEYQGSSADEVCFLDYARGLGYVFKNRTKTAINVEILGRAKQYELLMMLPFTDRKMMSVIVRDPQTGEVLLLSKGADNVMLAKSAQPGQNKNMETAISKFAKMGYRTLVFGKRILQGNEFSTFKQQYDSLQQQRIASSMNKEIYSKRHNEISEKLESRLTLIGVSAIEDKLQDGVPETIERLKQADIKIVMITGDKLETAENIGYLSNFVSKESRIFRLRQTDRNYQAEVMKLAGQVHGGQDCSLLIEGKLIKVILENQDPQIQYAFRSIIVGCRSLIFCRSTPAQKGMITKYFQKSFRSTVLCVGDGGNDVNMIQEADIGVGIVGKEGNQAASASDFYFSQFRFLDRLLLHHGRWAYYRIAYFFVYYGFKNVFITVMLFIYLAYCGWSGGNILSSIYLGAYNSVLTVTMTIYYGGWQQDINCDMYPPAKPYQPLFYKEFKRMGLFSYCRYAIWALTAVAAGTFVFFTTIYGFSSLNSADAFGRAPDKRGVSAVMAVSTFLFITLIITYDCYNLTIWTWFNLIVLTLVVSLIFFIIENFTTLSTNTMAYSAQNNLKFWLVTLVNVGGLFAVRVAYNTLRFALFPNLSQQLMVRRNHDYKVFSQMYRHEAVMMMAQPPGYLRPYATYPYQYNSLMNSYPTSTAASIGAMRQSVFPLAVPMPTSANLMAPQVRTTSPIPSVYPSFNSRMGPPRYY